MRIVLQRVEKASVDIDGSCVGRIAKGYVLLVGFEQGDNSEFITPMIDKLLKIKLFGDESGRFAFSLLEADGALLVISQFTLFADLKKGKKPSLSKALLPDAANQLYNEFITELKSREIPVETGEFGEYMQVHIQNDGPVTVILDSKDLFPSLYK
jgi:D-tyrosyl-tRNA(Tyr) deacylase